MKTLIPSILGGILGIGLVLVGAILTLRSPQSRDLPFEPYAAETERSEDTVPRLCSEISRRQLPEDATGPFDCAQNNTLYVTGKMRILALDSRANILWEQETQAPATALAADPADSSLWFVAAGNLVHRTADAQTKTLPIPAENNQLITAIAVRENRIALADAANRQILILDKLGNLIRRFGKNTDHNDIELILPSLHLDLLWTPDGRLLITNPGRQRVIRVRADGTVLSTWGHSSIEPDGFCGCCNPVHILRLKDGSIVTSEKGLSRVKIYSNDGVFMGFVDTPSNLKRSPGSTPVAYRIAASADGRIIHLIDPLTATLRSYKRRPSF
ncbi:MAG: hypothetical protein ACOCWJ_01870 [Verrucomicrobiota bacterium]